MTKWERVYVFISSTFNDMHAERDYLVKRVFPQLREWCEERKLRLIDVDLRWGVTEEDATGNRNAVKTCLARIDQCRPFFVCFLGQRRGWVPDLKEVGRETLQAFPELRQHLGQASITELEVLHALIKPLHRTAPRNPKVPSSRYEPVDQAFFYLRDSSYLRDLPETPRALRETFTNECIENLENRRTADRVLAQWRDEVIPKAARAANRPIRHYRASWDPAATTPELALPMNCPSTYSRNHARWRNQWERVGVRIDCDRVASDTQNKNRARIHNERITKGRLRDFVCDNDLTLAEALLSDLKSGIAARFPSHLPTRKDDPLHNEIDQQEQFLFDNCEGFIERPRSFLDLQNYVQGKSRQLLLLIADGGMGKSMLLANWITRERTQPLMIWVFRFIGQSDGSSTVPDLLRSILTELKELHHRIPDEIDIPVDPAEIFALWRKLFSLIGNTQRIVFVLDALDQLETGLKDLTWLPLNGLPENVHFIVSLRKDAEQAQECIARWKSNPDVEITEVKPFSRISDRKALVRAFLSQYLKELDDRLVDALVKSKGSRNPLFLKTALSELRVFGVFERLDQKIRSDFGTSPHTAFRAVLNRLENDQVYSGVPPKEAVPFIFGLLAHSRRGLQVSELVGLFHMRFGSDYEKESFRDDIELYLRQVTPFLARRDGRYDYFYESFKRAAISRCVQERNSRCAVTMPARRWHEILADYFQSQEYFLESVESQHMRASTFPPTCRPVNSRKVLELPWQRIHSQDWDKIVRLLTSLSFLEAKSEAGMVFDLITDFRDVLRRFPDEKEAKPILELFAEAIQRNIEFLHRHPTAMFQNIWNLCVWHLNPDTRRSCLAQSKTTEVADQTDTESWILSSLHSCHESRRESRNTHTSTHELVETRRPWIRFRRPPIDRLGSSEVANLQGHTKPPLAARFSPDGQEIASSSWDGTLRLWELTSGRERLCMRVPDHDIRSIQYFRGGNRILGGCGDGTLRIWSTETGQELSCMKDTDDGIGIVLLSKDESRVACTAGELIKIWDLRTEALLHCLQETDRFDMCIDWAPNGRTLVSACRDRTVRLWDVERGMELSCRHDHSAPVTVVAYAPDGRIVISGAKDGSLYLSDGKTGELLRSLNGHKESISGVDWRPDGSQLVSCSDDGVVMIWSIRSGRLLRTIKAHAKGALDVEYSSDGGWILSASKDRQDRKDHPLSVWDARNGSNICHIRTAEERYYNCSFSPDARYIVGCTLDRVVVWKAAPQIGNCESQISPEKISVARFAPGGETLVTGSNEGVVDFRNPATGESRECMKVNDENVFRLEFSCNGDTFLTSEERRVKVWDYRSRKLVCVIYQDGWAKFSPSGGQVLSITQEDLWFGDAKSGKTLRRIGRVEYENRFCTKFSPNGERILVCYQWDNGIQEWDTRSGERVRYLSGHSALVRSIDYSPDGERVVSGSDDGTMRIWDLAEAKELLCIDAKDPGVVCFSPSGAFVASASQANGLRVWNAENGTLVICTSIALKGVSSLAYTPSGERIIIACSDPFYFIHHSDRGTIICDSSNGNVIHTIEGNCEFEELVSGPGKFPYLCVRRNTEIAVLESETFQAVAWYPVNLDSVHTHPYGRAWVGLKDQHMSLFEIVTMSETT